MEYIKINYKAISISAIKRQLHEIGLVLLENVPLQNNILISIGEQLGNLSNHGIITKRQNIEDGFIHRVEALSTPLKDKYNFDITSTTNNEFLLHTDDFFNSKSADYILLHCWENSALGGESTIVDINEIIDFVPMHILEFLKSDCIKTPYGWAPVLNQNEKYYSVKFNLYDIKKFKETSGYEYNEYNWNLLNQFQEILQSHKKVFNLKKYDCLIIDNHRFLHGRNEFTIHTNKARLLKRLRIFSNE